MNAIKQRTDKLEELLGTISSLAGLMQDDLAIQGSDEKPFLSDHHRGAILTAIDELTWRGYEHLEVIDRETAS